MTTLAEFRSYVRTHLDLTSDDLPDELLDEFIREGSSHVQYARQRWNFYENTWTLTLVDAQQAYDYESAPVDDAASSYVVAEITQLFDDDGNELPMFGSGVANAADSSGTPTGYRLWGTTLTFDKVPSGTPAYKVVGYRKPADWIGDGLTTTVTPDTPEIFDNVIRQWALGKAYAHQDESATSTYFLDSAIYQLDKLIKQLDDLPPLGRIALNSGGAYAPSRQPKPYGGSWGGGGSGATTVVSGTSDHSALTNLAADGHPQYQTETRANSWFGTKAIGDLSDVDTSGVVENDTLQWSAENSRFEPVPASVGIPEDETGTTYTIDAADNATPKKFTNAALVTVTIPAEVTEDLNAGYWTVLFAEGAGGVTVDDTNVTVVGSSPNLSCAQNEILVLQKTNDADTWMVIGGTSA